MDEGGVGTSVMPKTDWEDVLLAYLHDPFDKALAVQGHETRAARYASAALGRDVSRRGLHRLAASADVFAAIAERVPSPTAGRHGERAVGPADGLGIVHPASGTHAALSLASLDPDKAAAVIEEIVRGLSGPRERFLAIWRLLPDAVAARFGDDAARLPADTRIPDHTLFQHTDVTAGLYAAGAPDGGAAFLSFTLGPVQPFIAAARSVRDLWSGSARYCEAPFEVRRRGSRNVRIRVEGERIGEKRNGSRSAVSIRCASATGSRLSPRSLDAVFTDPPCFGNVQYGELMDFCHVWLRRLVGNDTEGFDRPSTRSRDELTGNVTQARGLTHFTEGLSLVWSRMAEALKPGAPLMFTYHHNKLDAYCAVGVALLDAGLVCSASLPCPAEMGGSIHIHGTASSIMDTVFACRSSGRIPGRWLFDTPERLVEIAGEDRAHLAAAGRTPTHGDTRCIVFGHLTRMAVWKLRRRWNRALPVSGKIAAFSEALSSYGDCEQLARCAMAAEAKVPFPGPFHAANESEGEERGDVSF